MSRWKAHQTPLLVALAALVLGGLALAHPGLRFVDFVGFSGRARRVLQGQDMVHNLYPVGYPALLGGLKLLLGEVLPAGKLLSVLGGVLAFGAGLRLVGPLGALWMLALPATLASGSTEGTDMLAAGLTLAALTARHEERPALAGALLGAACLCRYTALAAVPLLLLVGPRRGRFLLALALATLPHWGLALALHRPVLPDQGENLAIAAGHPTRLWSLDTLSRWPRGMWTALVQGLGTWPAIAGALGLGLGLIRKDRRAGLLFGLASLHLAGLAVAFSNPRLCLPATLAAGLGMAFLVPERARAAVVALSLGLLGWNTAREAPLTPDEVELTAVLPLAQQLGAPSCVSTSPLFHLRREGWLIPCGTVRAAGGDPRRIGPAQVRDIAHSRGWLMLAVNLDKTRATLPGLRPFLSGSVPEGYDLVAETEAWRLFAILGNDGRRGF